MRLCVLLLLLTVATVLATLPDRDDLHVLHRVRAEFADTERREFSELLTAIRETFRHSIRYDAESYAHLLHPDVHYVDQDRHAECVGAEQVVMCLLDLERRARGDSQHGVEFQQSSVTQGGMQVVRELRAHRSDSGALQRELNTWWVHLAENDGRIVLIERMPSIRDPLRLPMRQLIAPAK